MFPNLGPASAFDNQEIVSEKPHIPLVNWHLFTVTASLAFLAGCATPPGEGSAKINPESVKLLTKAPAEPYENLGLVLATERSIQTKVKGAGRAAYRRAAVQTTDLKDLESTAIAALRDHAAEKGAEAVILTNLKIYAPETDTWTEYLDEMIVVEGIAIRFKDSNLPVTGPNLEDLPPAIFSFLPSDAYLRMAARAGRAAPASGPRSSAPTPALPINGENQPAQLEPYSVQDRPVQSFGFSVRIERDWLTRLVVRMRVEAVAEGSPADKAGLAPMTSIRKINGKPVKEIVASFARGSEINRALMNREPGDKVTLEIMDIGSTTPRTVTLTESWH